MDEMNMLREHHDTQPSPSLDVVAAARARLTAHTGQHRPRKRALRERRRPLPRLARLPLAAGALGLVLAAGLVGVQVISGDGDSGVLRAEPASAAEVLDQAATAARRERDPHPRPGQFVFAESQRKDYDSGIRPDSRARPGWSRSHRRIWLPVDGKRVGLLKSKPAIYEGEPVEDGWATMPLGRQGPGGRLAPDPNGYNALNRLPRDPGRLLNELYRLHPARRSDDPARDRSRDEEVFDAIQDMVAENYLPPSLRAALFEATKRIPITLIKDSVDAAGRHGVAVALTFEEGIREELIFDRKTYAVLGSRTVLADTRAYNKRYVDMKGVPQGQTLSHTALLAAKIVDRPGQL